MKKIAVCLSGQSRTWEYCIASIKSFLEDDDYQIDYFIHTWDINTYRPIETKDGLEKYNYISNTDINSYIDSYNPKLYKIDNYELFRERLNKKRFPKIKVTDEQNTNMLNQMYSFKQSIILKRIYERKHNFKYDFVLKIRPDTFFTYPSLRKNIEFTEPFSKGKFFSFQIYDDNWKTWLNNNWTPDLYWLFTSSDDSDIFSTYFSKSIKFLRYQLEDDYSEYNLYKFTNSIGFNPAHTRSYQPPSPNFHIYLIRPWNIPFQKNELENIINSKSKINEIEYNHLLKVFDYRFVNIHTLMQLSSQIGEEFENRKMLIDLLKEYDKLSDLQKYDIIDLINENSNIKNSIEEFINK
jgi:hypothetical protein